MIGESRYYNIRRQIQQPILIREEYGDYSIAVRQDPSKADGAFCAYLSHHDNRVLHFEGEEELHMGLMNEAYNQSVGFPRERRVYVTSIRGQNLVCVVNGVTVYDSSDPSEVSTVWTFATVLDLMKEWIDRH